MKQVMAEMYGDDSGENPAEKVSSADSGDYAGKCQAMADQIKEMAAEAGSDVTSVLAEIQDHLKGRVGEPSDDANENIEMTANADEGDGGKAPKKALIVAMLKKKNAAA